MKKYFKKTMAVVLTIITLLSICLVSASAASQFTSKNIEPSSSDYVYWNGSKMIKSSNMTSSKIAYIQEFLNWCYATGKISNTNLKKYNASRLTIDSKYGPACSRLAQAYQKEYSLDPDGKFGKNSINKMKSIISAAKSVTIVRQENPRTTTTKTNTATSNTNTTVKIVHPVTNGYCQGGRSGFLPYYRGLNKWAHVGVDYVTSSSDKNIKAFYSGTVTKVFWNGSAGNCIEIKHTYSGKTFYSYYFHLKSTSVKVNQTVTTGTKIGVMGNTGADSTGVHLHFQISDKCCVNSNNSLKTPTDNASYKSMGQTAQFNLDKAKIASSGITFYNPEKVLSKGLSIIL